NRSALLRSRLHELFAELAQDGTMGIVVVTHNQSLAARAHRSLVMQDSRLVDADAATIASRGN
ncbi:MAG: hypothetical protein ACO1Q7_13390, partial [Gemmatimonas sp.]